MKIRVFSQLYYPENIGPQDICEEWVKQGNEVEVITGLPNYPEGEVLKAYKFFKNRKQNIKGVNIKRCFEIGRKKGLFNLSINYLSFCISASIKSLFMDKDCDIVFVYQLSPITMAIPAIIYSKLKKKKIILYCLDLWPESLKITNMSDKSFIFKVLEKISGYVYRNCSKILISSTYFKEYLHDLHKVDSSKIEYLPQYSYDFGSNENKEKKISKVKILFAGNIGKAQNLDILIDAVKEVKTDKEFELNIVGGGSRLEELKEKVNSLNLQNTVIFHGKVSKEVMKTFYSTTDACILTLISNSHIGQTLPLKLLSYFSVGKPVIACASGQIKELILKNKCGLVADINSIEDIVKNIKDYIENCEKYIEYGENGRKLYDQNYTFDIFMKNINNLLGGI